MKVTGLSLIAVGGALSVAALHACSGDETPGDPVLADAGEAADAMVSPSRDAAPKPDDAKPSDPPAETGWTRWPDFDPQCNLRLPSSAEAMPAPFTWEPCPPYDGGGVFTCRSLAPRPEGGDYLVSFPQEPNAPGTPHLSIKFKLGDTLTSLVADPDGPVRFAARNPVACGVLAVRTFGNRYSFELYDGAGATGRGAAAIGSFGERPRLVEAADAAALPSFFPSSRGLLRMRGAVDLVSWDTLERTPLVTLAGTDATYQPASFVDLGIDGRIMVTAGTRAVSRQYAYALGKSAIDLLGASYQSGHGIYDAMSDGVDIAWVEQSLEGSTGHSGVSGVYTAPFSLDPQSIATHKKALPFRANQDGHTDSGRIACHHWARYIGQRIDVSSANPYAGLEITRLTDAKQWFLPVTQNWRWNQVLSLDCNEVIVGVDFPDAAGRHTNVARIPLASLP